MLGYSKSYLEEKYDEIVEFSELGRFIDVPIKNYSSGMKSNWDFNCNDCKSGYSDSG